MFLLNERSRLKSSMMLTRSNKHNRALERIGLPAVVFTIDGVFAEVNRLFLEFFNNAEDLACSTFRGLGFHVFSEAEEDITQLEFPADLFDYNLNFPQIRTIGICCGTLAEIVWYRITAAAEYDGDSSLQQLVVTFSDVTDLIESKKLQTKLKNRMEALADLAGGVVHDFNNILSTIIGHGEIAKSKLQEDDPVYEDVRQILHGGDRAIDLIRHILPSSRHDQARSPLAGRVPCKATTRKDNPTGSERIIVVDDEPMVANVIKAYLKRWGYRVLSFNDSMEAVKSFRKNPDCCDLVITDMLMPGMTGLELSREFLSIRKDLPIILLTGYGENINKDKVLRMGLSDYMLKPIKARELNLAVRKGLDHGNGTHH